MRRELLARVWRRRLREKFLSPFATYFNTEAASGVVLMAAALLALAWANSPWSRAYFDLWQVKATAGIGSLVIEKPLLLWINDGLMAVFFFLVGLEIKREILIGELSSVRKAALPIVAAIGGMVVPALLYTAVNAGGDGQRGWGIPMATDIAFALGVLNLLGSRVPLSLKVFLAAVAIVDDIGAVLVIAVFYSESVQWALVGFGFGILGVLGLLNRAGVRNPMFYVVLGIVLWVLFLKSGIHATVAGVLLALTIPARVHLVPGEFAKESHEALEVFDKAGDGKEERILMNEDQQSAVYALEQACERVQMPLQRIEHGLQPYVAFLIVPIFALANAGVILNANAIGSLGEPIGLGVLLGLVLGKPIGVLLAAWIAVKSGLASLPARVGWRQMAGVGVLAGVGFTMSLFITDLAFVDPKNIEAAKLSILLASIVAGVVGYTLLLRNTRLRRGVA
jgi:NhaA family Na+:H+ antiporter